MWLLDKFLKKIIKTGRLVITDYDGKVYEYGPGAETMEHGVPMHVRLTSKKASKHIARYPAVGAGEAYMWGWLVIDEPYDIRDMVLYVSMNAKVKSNTALNAKGPVGKAVSRLAAKIDSVNLRTKARKNAEHTYNL